MFHPFEQEGPDADEINRYVRGDDLSVMAAMMGSPLANALLSTEDNGVIGDFGRAYGIPLSALLAVKSELIALMTNGLSSNRVQLRAARAYAIYRLHADEIHAHDRQHVALNREALQAVVDAKIYRTAGEAGAAIWHAIETVEPILARLHGEMEGGGDQPDA